MSTTSGDTRPTHPVFRPVGDTGVLITFGDQIDDAIHAAVLTLDAAVSDAALTGVLETTPSYASLLIHYDPLVTTCDTLCAELKRRVSAHELDPPEPNTWRVPVCYDERFAPDLLALASQVQRTPADIINEHCRARYKVYMYGFAPGYAYLGGTPASIQVPRKASPVQHVLAGSVMIAGPQSLITTVEMPSGWWVIGRAVATPLRMGDEHPFRFAIGDEVLFEPVTAAEFQAREGEALTLA